MSALTKTVSSRPFTVEEIDTFRATVRMAKQRLAVLIYVLDHPDADDTIEPGADLQHGLVELAIASADGLVEIEAIADNAWKGGK